MRKVMLFVVGLFIFMMFLSPQNVQAEDEISLDLSIFCPSIVNESFPFVVTVKSNNISIANATVTFNGKTNVTNSSGMAGFFAPRVLPDGDNSFTIAAFKEGYNSTTVHITVPEIPYEIFIGEPLPKPMNL